MSVVLDSVILIDHFNGILPASEFVQSLAGAGCITAVTRAEVMAGADPQTAPIYAAILARFRWLELTPAVADLAAQLRMAHRWKLPDAFQAAAAQVSGLKLATRNTKDFRAEHSAFVVVPYTFPAP